MLHFASADALMGNSEQAQQYYFLFFIAASHHFFRVLHTGQRGSVSCLFFLYFIACHNKSIKRPLFFLCVSIGQQ